MDALLTRLWHKFGFFDRTELTPDRGRRLWPRRTAPHSDIDLLILYEGDELDEVLGLAQPASSSPCCGISSWSGPVGAQRG